MNRTRYKIMNMAILYPLQYTSV